MVGSQGRRLVLLGLLALAGAIFLFRIATPAIYDDCDGMYAEVPREMLVTGDWLTPHANGVRYLEKPPLLYWLTACSYWLGGVNEVTARLPVAIGSVATVGLCFLVGELCLGTSVGFMSGLILATAPGYYLFTRQIMPDTLFTALLSLAFYGYLRGYLARGRPFWGYALFYGGLGLALLAKGLIAVVFPLLTVGAFLALNRELDRWREMRLGYGLLIMLAVAAPWHIAVGLRNPGFFWFYFINEHLLRFLNRRLPHDYGTVPLPLFWGLHAVWFFPWSFLLIAGKPAYAPRKPAAEEVRLARFPLLWAGSVLLFFSFSTRLEYYSMPAYPAIAMLLGRMAVGWLGLGSAADTAHRRGLIRACGWLFGVGMLLLMAGTGALWLVPREVAPGLALIQPPTPSTIFFFTPVFSLSPASLGALRAPILAVSVTIGLGTLFAFWSSVRYGSGPALASLAVASVAILPWIHRCTEIFERDLSSRWIARVIQERSEPGDLIVVDGLFELYSSLAFYTERPLYIRDGRDGYLAYGSRYPDTPPLFLDGQQFERLWQAGPRLFYLTGRIDALPSAGYRVVAGNNRRVLVENRRSVREERPQETGGDARISRWSRGAEVRPQSSGSAGSKTVLGSSLMPGANPLGRSPRGLPF